MFEPGKWRCRNRACQFVNFARNTKCLDCGARRGTGVPEALSSDDERVAAPSEVEWVCDFCGRANLPRETHCYMCTSPSDEFLQRQREQQLKERQKREEERRRSSRSRKREERRKQLEDKRARFKEAMSQDTKSMPCMPQKIGETRGSGRADASASKPTEASRSRAERSQLDTDKNKWDSDDEMFDEFGRRKRGRPAKVQAETAGSRPHASSLSAKQQAALDRLKGKTKALANVSRG